MLLHPASVIASKLQDPASVLDVREALIQKRRARLVRLGGRVGGKSLDRDPGPAGPKGKKVIQSKLKDAQIQTST